jgi:ribosomal protein S18 acetylase RimI-like enzyme
MTSPDLEPLRLTVTDAGEILTLQRAAYVTEAQLHDDLQMPALTQSLADLEAELAEPANAAFGVREEGRLIACLRVSRVDDSTAEVHRIAVAPDRQGLGLGTALLLATEAGLPTEVTTIQLFTGEHSVANQRLYRRLGYEITRQTPIGRYHLVHMAKQRNASSARVN